MLLHSLRAFCKHPGGAGSTWKYFEAMARATRVSEKFAYRFRTELHSADSISHQWVSGNIRNLANPRSKFKNG